MEMQECKKPVALLSYYLTENVKFIFEQAGFEVRHRDYIPMKPSREEVVKEALMDRESFDEKMIREQDSTIRQYVSWFMKEPIDAVIEWQNGPVDYPLFDLYKNVRNDIIKLTGPKTNDVLETIENFKRPPVFILCLNWSDNRDIQWRESGYSYLLPVPFEMNELAAVRSLIMSRRPDKFTQRLSRQERIMSLGRLKQYFNKIKPWTMTPEARKEPLKSNEAELEEKNCDDDPYREIDEEIRNLFRISHQIKLARKREQNNKPDEE